MNENDFTNDKILQDVPRDFHDALFGESAEKFPSDDLSRLGNLSGRELLDELEELEETGVFKNLVLCFDEETPEDSDMR